MEENSPDKELEEVIIKKDMDAAEPDEVSPKIGRIADYLDAPSLIRIINKLTDYAETISEGKIAGIVNFNYSFSSTQTNGVIDLLVDISALSRIFTVAQKGSRDLEAEYISNIFSDLSHPENISSYLSIRNVIENRLNNQIQHYNMNMGKANSTLAMPLNELKSHVKTYLDLSRSHILVSSKAQHGYIAASLHDAYVTIMNRPEWWNDRTYIKYFFNEEASRIESPLILTRKPRLSLFDIRKKLDRAVSILDETRSKRKGDDQVATDERDDIKFRLVKNGTPRESDERQSQNRLFNDRMMATPFGKQYGTRIDSLLDEFFNPENEEAAKAIPEHEIQNHLLSLFTAYQENPGSMLNPGLQKSVISSASYLLFQEYGMKTAVEKFLYTSRKETFARFFSAGNRALIEEFMTDMFSVFFEHHFSSLFRIIRGQEVKKFACAFIIKRIYLKLGDSLTPFGFLLLKAIGKTGKIRVD